MLEASNERRRVGTPRLERAHVHPAAACPPINLPIERREPVLCDLMGASALDVEVTARTELLGSKLLGAAPHPVGDVRTVQAELAPLSVDAADHEMRVRVGGVVMIDCGPFDLATEVSL